MTTTSKLFQLALLSTLLVAAAQAAEQETPAPASSDAEARFKELDRNGDQRLSKSEAKAERSLLTTFDYLDSNGDGYITLREYTAHMKQ